MEYSPRLYLPLQTSIVDEMERSKDCRGAENIKDLDNVAPDNERKGNRTDSFDQEAQVIHDILQVLFAEDIISPAALQVVRRIKQICEEMMFPVKVTRSYYHERWEGLKNCLFKRALFMWTLRGPGESREGNVNSRSQWMSLLSIVQNRSNQVLTAR